MPERKSPIQPIKPSQVERKKHETLPDAVIESFNELIASKWDGRVSSFTLKEVRALIKSKMDGAEPDRHWLNVEPIYQKAGWRVTYDTPGWDETYDSFFEFRKR